MASPEAEKVDSVESSTPEATVPREGSDSSEPSGLHERRGSWKLKEHRCGEKGEDVVVEVECSTEEEQELLVNQRYGRVTPPGSPAAKANSFKGGDSVRRKRSESEHSGRPRTPSTIGEPSHHHQSPAADPAKPPTRCLLFPGVPCLAGTDAWVEKANKLLSGSPVEEVLNAADFAQLMKQFDLTHDYIHLNRSDSSSSSSGAKEAEADDAIAAAVAEAAAAEAEAAKAAEAAAEAAAAEAAAAEKADDDEKPEDSPISEEELDGLPPKGSGGGAEDDECVEFFINEEGKVEGKVEGQNEMQEHPLPDPTACPEIEVGEGWLPLTIVGDIHGQLIDLLHSVLGPVLRGEQGPTRFLFLGDYVDRGRHSVDVFALIAMLRVCFPALITVLRGNHEDAFVSRVYGFWQECESKYPDQTPVITQDDGACAWLAANKTFPRMPVAAIVRHCDTGRQIFCCHGGLSPALVPLDEMQQSEISRWCSGHTPSDPASPDQAVEVPAVRVPPADIVRRCRRRVYGELRLAAVASPFAPQPQLSPTTQAVLDGLLWSDPVDMRPEDSGDDSLPLFQQSDRGCGYGWTAQASRIFCEANNFDFICRAHQMVMPGFLWQHCDRVLTLFSASNYCGVAGNNGATLTIGSEWWPKGERPGCRNYSPPLFTDPDTGGTAVEMPQYFRPEEVEEGEGDGVDGADGQDPAGDADADLLEEDASRRCAEGAGE
eukprot:Hpha_TRINITY_DN15426_c2_g3::TRINITY_DN15426_c2_g3_i1::g.176546::m.176546/K04382/PPP2C; serine/threonine-protein phosphatase 2A catalytic subunit